MIEPLCWGEPLIEQIESPVPPGRLVLWWLGQSGFLFKSSGGLLAVDLYLSEYLTRKYAGTDREHVRMTRSPLRGRDLRQVDLLLASHKHSDHLDPETAAELLEASPSAQLIIPAAIRDHALGLGISADRIRGIDADDVVEAAGFRVRAIPAAHEGLERDRDGRFLHLGFVIESEGMRVYHSGDSLAYDGLVENLGPGPFDVLLLPINGRDSARGVPGNMSAAEAVNLAMAVRPRYLVPHHYDMFTFNTVPIDEFRGAARRLPSRIEARILKCGERWEITR